MSRLILKNPLNDKDFLQELLNEIDPINSDLSLYLKDKIFSMYSAIKYHGLYISNHQLEFIDEGDPIKIVHFPSAIISANLVNKSSTLISGSSGSGKTSTIRYIDRITFGSSIINMDNIIHCDKEIQKDEWLGFLDPKDVINGKGSWNIDWAKWTNGNSLIVDEVRRANSNFQNTMLLLMNDARIQHSIKFSKKFNEFRIYMTDNPRDTMLGDIYGSQLNHAFLDRITQRLLVESPKGWAMEKFTERRIDERSLGYNEDDFIRPMMDLNEIRCATILASKMPVDKEAEEFARNLAKNSDFCIRSPLFTKSLLEVIKPNDGLCEGCDFKNRGGYCQNIFGSSMRIYKDLIALSKAYAFWLRLKSVTKYLIKVISPDVISHRLLVPEKVLRDDKLNSFGNKRKYIKNNYIDYEFNMLSKLRDCKISFNKLIYGNGDLHDLAKIKNYANENLSVRIEMLPMVTIGIDISKNIVDSGNKEMYSCIEKDYKNFMNKVNNAYKSKNIELLESLLNECGGFPMMNLIQDIIHSYLRKLNYNKDF